MERKRLAYYAIRFVWGYSIGAITSMTSKYDAAIMLFGISFLGLLLVSLLVIRGTNPSKLFPDEPEKERIFSRIEKINFISIGLGWLCYIIPGCP